MSWAETLEEAFGIVGLLPDVFWSLTWNDYDSLLYRHRYREQQELAGHRLVAVQLYNLAQGFAKMPKPIQPRDYLPLPLVDGPPPPKVELTAEWWAKMEALATASGKKFPHAIA